MHEELAWAVLKRAREMVSPFPKVLSIEGALLHNFVLWPRLML